MTSKGTPQTKGKSQSEFEEKLTASFQQDGYVVIDSGLDHSILDGVIDDLSPYFGPNREHPIHVPHADHGRIQDAWHINQNVLKIARAPTILHTLKLLYGKAPHPFQTLNFHKGTQQAVHSDSIHFNSEPFGAMCGAWTALEDVGMEQGPLIYYPGSQRLEEMNYDYFGLKACRESYPSYLQELEKIIQEYGFKPDYGILRKGQTLIWSANILHGGSRQTNMALSRHSQVTHYYLGKVKAWRPVQSDKTRHYFTPEKVEDVSGKPFKYPLQPSLWEKVLGKIKSTFSND